MEFKFYVDAMPDWFMDKVSSNEVILHNCNYRRYDKDEAYFTYKGNRYYGGTVVNKDSFNM